jgi:hypothetical protein
MRCSATFLNEAIRLSSELMPNERSAMKLLPVTACAMALSISMSAAQTQSTPGAGKGYLAAKLNRNEIDTSRVENDLRHVFETCHSHPDMTIVAAFRTLRPKGH